MSFNDIVRKDVREKSGFQCCKCHNIGSVEAHHIIPESEEGPDTFENAAPLCPTCHAEIGGNPDKRKEIRQMRDWWYAVIEKKYGPSPDYRLLEEIKSGLENVQKNQISLESYKKLLADNALLAINSLTMGTVASGATGIAEAITASASPSPSPSSYIEDESIPIPVVRRGGDGGTVMLVTQDLSGSGKITAEGGKGIIGGKGGKIQIQTETNNFKGTVSASGGQAVEDSIKDK